MSEDIKLDVIRTTQDSLSKYIKKPPLTEKLLRKPPFRYLHDITTAVMRETGYLQGLYSQEELNPENIKDRESKIAFLEKLIAAVNLSTGVNITARPNKIVAGLDVAKTNELLQIIAKALEKKIDSSKAVEQVLNKKSKGVNQQNVVKKEISKSKPSKDSKTEVKAREPRTTDVVKKKTKEKSKVVEKTESRKLKTKKDESPTKKSKIPPVEQSAEEATNSKSQSETFADLSESKTDVEPSANCISDENHQSTESMQSPLAPPPQLSQQPPPPLEPDKDSGREAEGMVDNQETHPEPATEQNRKEERPKPEEELKRPQSARAVHRKKSVRKSSTELDGISSSKVGEPREAALAVEGPSVEPKQLLEKKSLPSGHVRSERPRTAARPASARRGAPRLRDRATVLLTENDNKEAVEPVNVIVDSKLLARDDDETLVTVEAAVPQSVADQVVEESPLLAGDQGHLVSQILETQKELEDTGTAAEIGQKLDIRWGSGRQEVVAREVDKLRTVIQALTRAANPLGKLIDFLQEDVDSMQTELETWTTTNRQLTAQLQAEERLTEESIEPLARQLEEMDQLIEEQLEEMSVAKAVIIRNDERLNRLLKTNSSHLPR